MSAILLGERKLSVLVKIGRLRVELDLKGMAVEKCALSEAALLRAPDVNVPNISVDLFLCGAQEKVFRRQSQVVQLARFRVELHLLPVDPEKVKEEKCVEPEIDFNLNRFREITRRVRPLR